ncbi:Arm DNA-binding domain-containing protein [Mycobacterium shinjukuense]|nr:Arm DNA-binding domain-containing protein [Mycobacterium shinjukuense]
MRAHLVATIEKYETSSGATRYRVRYRTPDRRQTDKRGFKTKRDAEAWQRRTRLTNSGGSTSHRNSARSLRGNSGLGG